MKRTYLVSLLLVVALIFTGCLVGGKEEDNVREQVKAFFQGLIDGDQEAVEALFNDEILYGEVGIYEDDNLTDENKTVTRMTKDELFEEFIVDPDGLPEDLEKQVKGVLSKIDTVDVTLNKDKAVVEVVLSEETTEQETAKEIIVFGLKKINKKWLIDEYIMKLVVITK